jgi:hypothetical protein
LLVILFIPSGSFAQDTDPVPPPPTEDYDSLLDAYLAFDSLLLADMESDTLSLLDLIDSLIALDFSINTLSFRAGYTSSILNAGRDYGFKQYGFSSGISYYHKSGIYVDGLGYWNSETQPNYYLTTFSAGYIGSILKKWSYLVSYDHLFYNKSAEVSLEYPLTNAVNFSSYYDLKYLSAGFDYSFLFGSESAHRIRPNIAGVIRTNKIGFIDRITFMPGASMLFGNSTILTTSVNKILVRQIIDRMGLRRFQQLYKYNREQVEEIILETSSNDVFGLMNYSFSLPIYIYMGNFILMTSYTLNKPVALPGEFIDLDPNSYFGVSLIYNIYFK